MTNLIDQFLEDHTWQWLDDHTEFENLQEWFIRQQNPSEWVESQAVIARVSK